MDILDRIAIDIPCTSCGQHYEVTLKQVTASQQMLHEGCPAKWETECPPLYYSVLEDEELIRDLQNVWRRLEARARGVGGEIKLRRQPASRK